MEIEKKISYTFRKKEYLENALTHSSFANEKGLSFDNERLEFLGDAILELTISEKLYKTFTQKTEGELTKLRASLVCEGSLAKIARKFKIGEHLRLGNGEEMTGGKERDSILSDALEAIIGAVYLDGGFENAKYLIENLYHDEMKELEIDSFGFDCKTQLQELAQRISLPITYTVIEEIGPPHNRTFKSQVSNGETVFGQGEGKSKKESEQNAAYKALEFLAKNNGQSSYSKF